MILAPWYVLIVLIADGSRSRYRMAAQDLAEGALQRRTPVAGPECVLESRFDLGESAQASPAIAAGRMFVCTAGQLNCYR